MRLRVERRNLAWPLYWAVIGPTLTFTTPRYSSPSTSWSCAPGRHGAIRSTSVSTAHARSTGQRHTEVVGQLHRSRSSTVSMSSLRPSHGTACTSSGLRRISGRAPRRRSRADRSTPPGRGGPGCRAARRRSPPRWAARRRRRHRPPRRGGHPRLVGQPDHDGVVASRPAWRTATCSDVAIPSAHRGLSTTVTGGRRRQIDRPATTTTSSSPASIAAATARSTSVRPSTTASCFGPSPRRAEPLPCPRRQHRAEHRHVRRRYRPRTSIRSSGVALVPLVPVRLDLQLVERQLRSAVDDVDQRHDREGRRLGHAPVGVGRQPRGSRASRLSTTFWCCWAR